MLTLGKVEFGTVVENALSRDRDEISRDLEAERTPTDEGITKERSEGTRVTLLEASRDSDIFVDT